MDNLLERSRATRAVQKPARDIRALEIGTADFHFRTAPAAAVLLSFPEGTTS
jgi:hypothetical protein